MNNTSRSHPGNLLTSSHAPRAGFADRLYHAILLVTAGVLLPSASFLHGQKVLTQKPSPGEIARLEESVSSILTLSEEELRARVPVASGGIRFTDCPNCDGGARDQGPFSWDPERPNQISCQTCFSVFPDNPNYPDNEFIEVEAPEGVHRFAYWADASGYRHFFEAHVDFLRREWLEEMTRNLGKLYLATGDNRYARPAAILLQRFAETVPGYARTYDAPFVQKQFTSYRRPRVPDAPEFGTAIWSDSAYTDIPRGLLEAYDALYQWNGWAGIGGSETRAAIENNLFAMLVEFTLGFVDPLEEHSPRLWRDAAYAARLLDRPEWMHEVTDRFDRMIASRFLYDGHWFATTPGIHVATIERLQEVAAMAAGYSDPAGYAHPKTRKRIDDLNLASRIPPAALAAAEDVRLPDGRILPLNDTWAVHSERDQHTGNRREQSGSFVLPGLGVAVLGAGNGENQVMAWLNFTSGVAHKHRDALSIGLFGHGQELLPDLGLTHTRYRQAWASSMMAHNTVVVDGREPALDRNHVGNHLLAFATNDRNFHYAVASSSSAYGSRTQTYRRTLILLGEGSQNAYLLDIFEINGGRQHDYLMHASADSDSTVTVGGADPRPFRGTLVNPGASFSQPRKETDTMGASGAFSFIRELHSATASEPVRIDIRSTVDSSRGTRTVFAPLPDATFFLGASPGIRLAGESDANLDEFFRPSAVVRRNGQNLSSTFVAAHEPVNGFPGVHDVRTRQTDGRLWISVRHGRGRDYISLAFDNPSSSSYSTAKGTFTTDAACAVVRLNGNDAIVSAHVVGGSGLQFRNYQLDGPGRLSGPVVNVYGDRAGASSFAIDIDEPVHDPDLLVIEFPDGSSRAYTVERADRHPVGVMVQVKERTGFAIRENEIVFTAYPHRTIEGTKLTARLIDSTHSD